MFILRKTISKIDMGKGVLRQDYALGQNLNVLHWNIADGGEVKLHQHPQEQFGYVISGGFKMNIGKETKTISAGDGYVIPPNVPHSFVAVGETEAIDVFSPIRNIT